MQGIQGRITAELTEAVMRLAGRVPGSALQVSSEPAAKAEVIIQSACRRAATISASLAIPPGPWGMATVIPDLVLIWDLQARMVADIAAVYGQSASLGREHMLWCLFKHTGAQALRDFVVRGGERLLIKKASMAALQSAAQAIGLKLTQRTINKSASRFVPLIGAVGVGVYAWRDTREVGRAAMALFSDMSATKVAHEA